LSLADQDDALVAALQGAQDERPAPAAVISDDATAALEGLKDQLRESDVEASETANREEALLRQALGTAKAEALFRHIGAFDFNLALELLERE
jgi:hypothetical protein